MPSVSTVLPAWSEVVEGLGFIDLPNACLIPSSVPRLGARQRWLVKHPRDSSSVDAAFSFRGFGWWKKSLVDLDQPRLWQRL